jgi:hypothetical protein
VKIEAEEDGDGDSDCSAAKAGELFASMFESASDRREVVVLEDDKDIVCDSPHNMIEIKRGLAPEVKVSAPPADWVPDHIKLECAEPSSFLVIENPGGWGQYPFCPKFHNKAKGKDIKKGQCSRHALPTGARPAPVDNEGKREKAGWAFHYRVWSNHENANFRSVALYKNPFPDTKKGILDFVLLKHMGLTKRLGWKSMTPLSFASCFFLFAIRLNPVSPMTQGCLSTQKQRTGRRSMLLLWELVGLMGMSTSK